MVGWAGLGQGRRGTLRCFWGRGCRCLPLCLCSAQSSFLRALPRRLSMPVDRPPHAGGAPVGPVAAAWGLWHAAHNLLRVAPPPPPNPRRPHHCGGAAVRGAAGVVACCPWGGGWRVLRAGGCLLPGPGGVRAGERGPSSACR